MLHEVLHMALLHVTRRQRRDPHIWNIAADIVVNDLILRNTSFKLPDGAIIDNKFQDKSVEYIYEILLKTKKYEKFDLMINDILQPSSGNQEKKEEGKSETEREMTKQLSEEEIDEISHFGAIRWKFLRMQMSIS